MRQPDADRSCNPPCSQPHAYCSEVCATALEHRTPPPGLPTHLMITKIMSTKCILRDFTSHKLVKIHFAQFSTFQLKAK